MNQELNSSTHKFKTNYMLQSSYANKTMRSLMKNVSLMLVVSMGMAACSLDSLVKVDDPEVGSNIARDLVKSKRGAMGVYYSAIKNLSQSYSSLSLNTGLLSDELRDIGGITTGTALTRVDNRSLEIFDGQYQLALDAYLDLNKARTSASQSRYLLRTYSDSTALPLIAHAYVIEGYSIVLLAEALCSGFPISEVPFEGDVKLSSGVSTTDAFNMAIAMFDSALSITHDSLNFINLARVGKGRALLNLGEFEMASQVVNDVPDGFQYNLTYTQGTAPGSNASAQFWTKTSSPAVAPNVGVGNFEGVNGILWVASTPATQDPRVPLTTQNTGGTVVFTTPVRQNKFPTGSANVPLARTIDARLIQIEAAYHRGGTVWLDMLNDLRATISLSALSDPGTPDSRVKLIFQERAYWNFLLGQRHGDLRRLIRQYNRTPQNTFPTGTYHNIKGNYILYGEAVVFTTGSESQHNYKYQGCENYNA